MSHEPRNRTDEIIRQAEAAKADSCNGRCGGVVHARAGLPVEQHDVLRLDVPVPDPLAVHEGQSFAAVRHNLQFGHNNAMLAICGDAREAMRLRGEWQRGWV